MEIYQNKEWSERFYSFIKQSEKHQLFEEKHILPLIPTGKAAILLGCAGGRYVGQLVQKFEKVTVLDISNSMLLQCKAEYGKDHIEYIQQDLNFLSDLTLQADFILSTFVVHYVKDLDTLFQAVFNLLVTNGRFIFSIPHPHYSKHKLKNGKAEDYWPEIDTIAKYYHHSKENYLRAIRKSELQYIDSIETAASRTNFEYNWILELKKT